MKKAIVEVAASTMTVADSIKGSLRLFVNRSLVLNCLMYILFFRGSGSYTTRNYKKNNSRDGTVYSPFISSFEID